MSVSDLLEKFQYEIYEDIEQLKKASEIACTWEKKAYDDYEHLNIALDEVWELKKYKDDLKTAIQSIKDDQRELEKTLDKLDGEVATLQPKADQRSTTEEHSRLRSTVFSMAQALLVQLHQMDDKLGQLTKRSEHDDVEDDDRSEDDQVDAIIDILNEHNVALSWFEDKSKDLHIGNL